MGQQSLDSQEGCAQISNSSVIVGYVLKLTRQPSAMVWGRKRTLAFPWQGQFSHCGWRTTCYVFAGHSGMVRRGNSQSHPTVA